MIQLGRVSMGLVIFRPDYHFYHFWRIIMKTLSKMLKAFWLEESGLTVVEYAVAGTLISLAVVGAFGTLGTTVAGQIGAITAAL